MRLLRWIVSLAFGLLLSSSAVFAVDGTFRGKIADPPSNEPAVKGWIFVEGRNRMLRRVEVAHAEIVYGEEVPAASQRHSCNSDCLIKGQEVRITAHQDASGEWRAKRVEILKTTIPTPEKRLSARSLPNFTPFGNSCEITTSDDFCIAPSTGEI
ncbi:MAG TPA: hypothetical protein VN658_09285 [Candidatus Acidoferrales bacterium]|nr:hypothetical protein [Candidatus Acidoferrales bacterium]